MSAMAAASFSAGIAAPSARRLTQVKSRASRTVTRAASKPKPGINGVPYVAANRFVIPDSDPAVVARFEEEMRRRETLMASLPGFTHCGLTKDGAHEYTFAQEWATKQAYEDYMNNPERRRSHMAVGVYQYLPSDKWSVPENFTPILPTPK
mmetsp:Transcript_10956/g.17566  ORF Transcript_10956/g.17566 Transcript_10956/m.17566 type:complete len:151 (+) Transcript_10956:69-521(+)|eukprot:CAMPEP_0181349880 /NCGR_PEP_ID=MMETSP1106-20121128/965_1 /TAXON_ID=81844 /ORGANISM="Mantoniella antarctica, Strain SL-175" /LENGTH=150 /DNA_ID=CAMNT_0023462309 /DNA_START=50 /DNA_END=502 /DNA_ORIENTATION=+